MMDATLIPSARRPRKVDEVIPDELAADDHNDDADNDHHSGYTGEVSYTDDQDIRWTGKGKVFCYGYKRYLAVDVGHGFILGGHGARQGRHQPQNEAYVRAQGSNSRRKPGDFYLPRLWAMVCLG